MKGIGENIRPGKVLEAVNEWDLSFGGIVVDMMIGMVRVS